MPRNGNESSDKNEKRAVTNPQTDKSESKDRASVAEEIATHSQTDVDAETVEETLAKLESHDIAPEAAKPPLLELYGAASPSIYDALV